MQMADGKLAFSSNRAGRYVASRWLLKFGDPTGFKQATKRKGFRCDQQGCTGKLRSGEEVAIVKHPGILAEECRRATIVITTFNFRSPCPSATRLITPRTLRTQGIQAIYFDRSTPDEIKVVTARTRRGDRPWTAAPERIRRKRQPSAPAQNSNPKPKHKTPPKQAPKSEPPLQVRI